MTAAAPGAATAVAGLVDARLAAVLEAEEKRWAGVHRDLGGPFAALRQYVTAGGKRLRPAFCYWSFVGAGGDPGDSRIVDAAAALEMLHSAALVHDDLIDGSDRRHGVDAVHVALAGQHRERGWHGDAGAFGRAGAVLVGDLALVYSSLLLGTVPPAAAAVFEEMRLEVNVGQYLDVAAAAAGPSGSATGDADLARLIVRYKTAKYTIERPMHLGVALADPAGAGDAAAAVSDFALPLGEAFQLRDDILGVFGEPAVTGKPVGDDLRERKLTLLAALAASRGGERERRAFVDAFASGPTGTEAEAMADHIRASGAKAEVEGAIEELLRRASQAVDSLPFTPEARTALGELARYVAGRDR